MNVRRIMAVALIFLLGCAGWWILGTTTLFRSNTFLGRLGGQVESLWGKPLVQEAPTLSYQTPGTTQERWVLPERSDLQVGLRTDYRKKGLLWYSTYVCDFRGAYTITNPEPVSLKVRVHFRFPAPEGTYDNFGVQVGGKPLTAAVNTQEGVAEILELAAGETRTFEVNYRTRGLREWRYRLDRRSGRVRNLALKVQTDFRNVDYPEGCLSPMTKSESETGMSLGWDATDLITREDIGVVIPDKLNPGPLTTRITFFAPVCLLFFFVLVTTIGIRCAIPIHPMHYLFVAAGFFAFHLLLAYMAGLVAIHVAFAVSAAVSVVMVTGYLSAALGRGFPWKAAALGQMFFLVLFSYSFFFQGITGLTVAVGAVLTLGVLMIVTARTDWNRVFGGNGPTPMRVREVVPPPIGEAG